jgi:hypothetical protein
MNLEMFLNPFFWTHAWKIQQPLERGCWGRGIANIQSGDIDEEEWTLIAKVATTK